MGGGGGPLPTVAAPCGRNAWAEGDEVRTRHLRLNLWLQVRRAATPTTHDASAQRSAITSEVRVAPPAAVGQEASGMTQPTLTDEAVAEPQVLKNMMKSVIPCTMREGRACYGRRT